MRFLQQCCWRFCSCGMWLRVFGQMLLDISKDPFATFFRINTPKKDLPDDKE